MGNLNDLLLLIGLGTALVIWLKLTRARELAVLEVRRQCQSHGLQLLDETVSLRALRWRRVGAGRFIERGYGFEVSVDGDDREPGRLWMRAGQLSAITLPTMSGHRPATAGEVNDTIARLGRREPARSAADDARAKSETRASLARDNVLQFGPRSKSRSSSDPGQPAE